MARKSTDFMILCFAFGKGSHGSIATFKVDFIGRVEV